VHPEKPEIGESFRDLPREDGVLEPRIDAREDLVADEVAYGIPDRALLVVEEPVDLEVVERVDAERHGAA
jgi:hypothetical protein